MISYPEKGGKSFNSFQLTRNEVSKVNHNYYIYTQIFELVFIYWDKIEYCR